MSGIHPSLIIPFVSDLDKKDERVWLDALAVEMPDEGIVSFRTLDAPSREAATVAVVANPNPTVFASMPNLIWVQSVWAGVDKLMTADVAKPFAVVRLVDPELSRTMAEAVLAWTLYLHRDMPAYGAQQRRGMWQPLQYRRPADCTVGILGFGELGQASAKAVAAVGFPVMAWSRTPKVAHGIETFTGTLGLRAPVAFEYRDLPLASHARNAGTPRPRPSIPIVRRGAAYQFRARPGSGDGCPSCGAR